MTEQRKTAGKIERIFDADFEAIREELYNEHRLHCDATHDPYIWIDTTEAFSDGRNIYVSAECQNCLKGSDMTPVRESEKFHTHTSTGRTNG